MHYGSEEQKKAQKLRLVVYKHGSLGKVPQYTKDKLLKKISVFYQTISIQECKCFDPFLLRRLMVKGFKYFNTVLSDKSFERYYELDIVGIESDKIEVLSVTDVTDDKDELKRLH